MGADKGVQFTELREDFFPVDAEVGVVQPVFPVLFQKSRENRHAELRGDFLKHRGARAAGDEFRKFQKLRLVELSEECITGNIVLVAVPGLELDRSDFNIPQVLPPCPKAFYRRRGRFSPLPR
jgi:hypothetical protein